MVYRDRRHAVIAVPQTLHWRQTVTSYHTHTHWVGLNHRRPNTSSVKRVHTQAGYVHGYANRQSGAPLMLLFLWAILFSLHCKIKHHTHTHTHTHSYNQQTASLHINKKRLPLFHIITGRQIMHPLWRKSWINVSEFCLMEIIISLRLKQCHTFKMRPNTFKLITAHLLNLNVTVSSRKLSNDC